MRLTRLLAATSPFFFFHHPSTPEIYTLSLHDALPICYPGVRDIASFQRYMKKCQLTTTFYLDRKSTRLNSSHANISYAVFCLKKKRTNRSSAQSLPSTRTRPTSRLRPPPRPPTAPTPS